MYYRFSMDKMVQRIKAIGLWHLVGREELQTMKALDGKLGTNYNWSRIVDDEETAIWIPADKDQPGNYVNVNDCVPFDGSFAPWEEKSFPKAIIERR